MSEPSPSESRPWRERLQRLRARSARAVLFASGVAAALAALLLYQLLVPAPHQLTTREVNDSVVQALASATPLPPFSARVYQVIQPSLILVQAQAPGTDGKVEHDVGSGVIINDQGDILTSLHVVAQA
ncbi:MAG: S1C family serine protease, partial [Chloroflexota bacterium]|nr:S1C family serine protease [Chloroflexota bacterium]